MAATQQLPSWMTLSTVVITNSEGVPVTTSTTTLELPLTYYGPSIPLGTDGAWTWGGLYPPSPSPSSTASPTATPTSASNFPTVTPTSLSSSFRSFPSITPTTTTTLTPTPTVATTASTSNLSKGALIGIIFGAIVAFITLLLLLVCLIRWRVRRNHNGYRQTPIWTHWEVISPSGPRSANEDRPAGVGSPRGSGEEADSFLQHGQTGTQYHSSVIRPVASLPPGAAPPAVGSTHSGGSGHTSSSAVTDYGILLPDGGRIGQAYARDDDPYFPSARPSSEMAGHIIPPGQLLRLDDEEGPQSPPRMYGVSPTSDSDPLLPPFTSLSPPPMLDIEKHSMRKAPSVTEKDKSLRSLSVPASDMEASEVFTARRVRVQDVGIRSPGSDETSSHSHFEASSVAGPSGWRDSFGLGSLQKLRLSWFGGSSRNSRSSNGRSRSDDIESSQSLLQPPRRRQRSGLQLVVTDDRPISTLSSKSAVSGNTIYHDAVSRLGTPVSVPSRVMTPAAGGGVTPGGDIIPMPIGAPPAYALEDPYSSVGSRLSLPFSQGVDVLDLPVPVPASQLGTSGGTIRGGTPPGLQSGSHSMPSRDSLSVITGSSNEAGITIDVLDAEPPMAGEGWRFMAGGILGASRAQESGERATSGTPQLVRQQQIMLSEQGSIHSMRSLLSPLSRSSASGSGPGSHHSNGLSGSMSSRPSSRSRVPTTSSASLRSGSISRLRGAASTLPISPAVSAFGPANEASPLSPPAVDDPTPSSGSEPHSVRSDNDGRNRISVLGPMPSFTARSVLAPTIRSVGATTTSDETQVTRTTDTEGTSMTGFGGSGGGENLVDESDGLVERLRLGDFDIGRLRI